jgi:D-beta-D-heptose 7-phosphate kinase/D-beta-D-heptose 1-phosphate adenosyltransferase
MIEYASSLGSLVIGIDTDERIKKMKGMDRPYHTLQQRIFNLLSIKGVYTVVSFNTDDELIRHIQLIEPDIFVIGSDYKDKQIIGSEYVKEIRYFDRLENLSTTDILNYEYNSNR